MTIKELNIRIINETARLRVDEDAIRDMLKACIASIKRTHKSFPYSPSMLGDVEIGGTGIIFDVINDLIKEPDLMVDIAGEGLDYICHTELVDSVDFEPCFPHNLSDEKKLDVMKYIIHKIGEEYELHK